MKLSQHSAKLGQHWADVHQIFQVMDKMVSKRLSIFQELCEFLEVQKRVCLVERKCCKTSVTCKIDFNTAENEPPKVCCKGLTPPITMPGIPSYSPAIPEVPLLDVFGRDEDRSLGKDLWAKFTNLAVRVRTEHVDTSDAPTKRIPRMHRTPFVRGAD